MLGEVGEIVNQAELWEIWILGEPGGLAALREPTGAWIHSVTFSTEYESFKATWPHRGGSQRRETQKNFF